MRTFGQVLPRLSYMYVSMSPAQPPGDGKMNTQVTMNDGLDLQPEFALAPPRDQVFKECRVARCGSRRCSEDISNQATNPVPSYLPSI